MTIEVLEMINALITNEIKIAQKVDNDDGKLYVMGYVDGLESAQKTISRQIEREVEKMAKYFEK